MRIKSENNNAAILKELGLRIKRGRIDMQISQADFAHKAGISVRTLSVAENGGDLRMSNLLRILRVLGSLENLNTLLPELDLNPEGYLTLGKERQRVSRKQINDNKNTAWKWGDEECQ